MKYDKRCGAFRSQRGVAAVEMAVLLIILVVMFAFPLFLARCFWHYTVVQKAAHDAARYLATVPVAEMKSPTRAAAAVQVAEFIATSETAELNPGGIFPVSVTVNCAPASCNLGTWGTVRVFVGVRMYDPIFHSLTWPIVGDEGVLLYSDVEIFHVGS